MTIFYQLIQYTEMRQMYLKLPISFEFKTFGNTLINFSVCRYIIFNNQKGSSPMLKLKLTLSVKVNYVFY